MNFITIPQNLINEKELVLISRREFEALVKLANRAAKEVTLSKTQRNTNSK